LTMGNNDFYPRSSAYTPMGPWLAKVARLWEPFFPDKTAHDTFELHGSYAYRLPSPSQVTVLSFNTVLFTPEFSYYPPSDPAEQDWLFAWLESQFAEARLSDRRIYLLGHVGPGNQVYQMAMNWHEAYLTRFTALICQHVDVLAATFYAHTHRDSFGVSPCPNSNAKTSYFIAPGVSPNSYTNPAFRLYTAELHGTVLDYTQYYAALYDPSLQVQGNPPVWDEEYDFDVAYNESSVDTDVLSRLLARLRANPQLLAEWFERSTVLLNVDKWKWLCSMAYPERDAFLRCLEQLPLRRAHARRSAQ